MKVINIKNWTPKILLQGEEIKIKMADLDEEGASFKAANGGKEGMGNY